MNETELARAVAVMMAQAKRIYILKIKVFVEVKTHVNLHNVISCNYNFFPNMARRGHIGIFGFVDLANVWFSFLVFTLENCSFSVMGSSRVCR